MTNTASDNTQNVLAQSVTLLIFFGIIGLLYVMLKFFPFFTGAISVKESALTDFGNIIVVLSFIALALQSALQIFVTNWRVRKKTQKQRRVEKLNKEIDELKDLIKPTLEARGVLETEESQTSDTTSQSSQATKPIPSIPPQQLTELREQIKNKKENLEEAENDLDLYQDETKIVVSRLSLLAGITISLTGVRILQPFIDVTLEGPQMILFHAVDILLTGGLLAGGSEGINRLTKVYENFTDVSKTIESK